MHELEHILWEDLPDALRARPEAPLIELGSAVGRAAAPSAAKLGAKLIPTLLPGLVA